MEDEAPPAKAASHVDLSSGKIVKDLVAVWKFRDGTYRFDSDGSYTFHYDRLEPAGPGQPPKRSTGDEKGRWSADSATLFLKGARGIDFKMGYVVKQAGNVLELKPPYAKIPDTFTRLKS